MLENEWNVELGKRKWEEVDMWKRLERTSLPPTEPKSAIPSGR